MSASFEDELGALLINRTTRQIALTAAGEIYLARASAILADLGQASTRRRARPPERPRARSGFRPRAPSAMPSLASASSTSPRTIPRSASTSISTTISSISSEEGFDIAIRMTRLADSAMIARRLASLDFCIVGAPDLVEKLGRPTHPSQIAGYPAVIDSNSRMFSNWVFRDPETKETIPVAMSGRFTANSPVTVRAAAIAGLGLALSPTFVVRKDLDAGRLVTVLDGLHAQRSGDLCGVPASTDTCRPACGCYVDYLAGLVQEMRFEAAERRMRGAQPSLRKLAAKRNPHPPAVTFSRFGRRRTTAWLPHDDCRRAVPCPSTTRERANDRAIPLPKSGEGGCERERADGVRGLKGVMI